MTMVLAGLVVFLTHALEAVTGFGCTVLALPFVTGLLGLERAVPLLAVVAWILALYIVVTKFRDIVWKEFLIIVLFVGLGMPLGIFAFNRLDTDVMKKLLAVFIIVVSIIQLKKLFFPPKEDKPLPRAVYYVILVLGGIIHGAFASGGPFVVLYASRALPEKGGFRATLCLLWTTLNSVLMISYLISGTFSGALLKDTGLMLPFLLGGIVAGEMIHHRVNEEFFRRLVFSVLLVTGIFMLIF